MNNPAERGFTLIELLTVIAIIAILASLVLVGAPLALERAKITRQQGNFRALHTALSTYAGDYGTLPPMYGYKRTRPLGPDPAATPDWRDFHLTSYMELLGQQTNLDLYDQFAPTHDVNRNESYEHLEFVPARHHTPEERKSRQLFRNVDQVPLPEEERPVVYVAVNSADFEIFRQYCERRGFLMAEQWDPNDAGLRRLRFPNTQYDRFVLISVGPVESAGGVINPPPDVLQNYVSAANATDPDALYHMLALRAYYLATRDLNDNGFLDFDYLARSREGEAAVLGNENLPDPNARPPLFGPLIYQGD